MKNNETIKIYELIMKDIIDLRFSIETDDILKNNKDFLLLQWKHYIGFYEKIKLSFKDTIISENIYLKNNDLNEFFKYFLDILDKSVVYSIYSTNNTAYKPLMELQVNHEIYNEKINEKIIHEEKTNNNFIENKIILELIRNSKIKRHEFNEVYEKQFKKSKDIIFKSTLKFFYIFFKRFIKLLDKCESPLEEAFFISIFSNYHFNDIFFFENKFDNQYKLGKYRLDFVLLDKKINIETDGHNFHEKTEEQAVNDRERDRFLQLNNWTVLRFHRKELETNIQNCIEQVFNIYTNKTID